MKNNLISSIIIVLCSIISCKKENLSTENQESVIIKNGTVIGNINLSEYRHEIEIQETTQKYQIQDRDNIVLKTCSVAESSTEWKTILAKVDFETFKKLPAFYGTTGPALGDIGYEYLEISKGTDTYRIAFPKGSDVNEIADLLKIARAKRLDFEQSCK
jgi:hypothetical protein